jgi:catechol 2,3-dioxygenase-like lactoylglutathione lyase family enzyme
MTWPLPNDTDEYYGMPAFPTLEVGDVETSARWYRALGFRHVFTIPGPGDRPALVHLWWVRYADLLLRPTAAAPASTPGLGITLSFAMFDREGERVDDVAARARAIGATVLEEPGDRPWNARETTILDPDGYRLAFTEPVATSGAVTMEEVIERVQRG